MLKVLSEGLLSRVFYRGKEKVTWVTMRVLQEQSVIVDLLRFQGPRENICKSLI